MPPLASSLGESQSCLKSPKPVPLRSFLPILDPWESTQTTSVSWRADFMTAFVQTELPPSFPLIGILVTLAFSTGIEESGEVFGGSEITLTQQRKHLRPLRDQSDLVKEPIGLNQI